MGVVVIKKYLDKIQRAVNSCFYAPNGKVLKPSVWFTMIILTALIVFVI